MNGRDWIRRHSAATTAPPERNGAGPAEAVRIREREAETAAADAGCSPVHDACCSRCRWSACCWCWSRSSATGRSTAPRPTARPCSSPRTRSRPAACCARATCAPAELAGDARTMAALVPERELDALLGRDAQRRRPGRRAAATRRARRTSREHRRRSRSCCRRCTRSPASSRPAIASSVLATYGSGSGQARTKAIARGLEVLAVGSGAELVSTAPPPRSRSRSRCPIPRSRARSRSPTRTPSSTCCAKSGGARAAPIPPAREGGP